VKHTTVGLSKRDVVDVVLDLARYRQAGRKIGRVGEIARASDTGTSVGESRQRPPEVTTTGLRFGWPIAGAARWFLEFEGTFDCEEPTTEPSSATARRSSSSARGAGSPSRCFGAG
jgi:hypothetical protein